MPDVRAGEPSEALAAEPTGMAFEPSAQFSSWRAPRRSLTDLDSRAAPGLYLVGWLLSVAGLVVVSILFLGDGHGPGVVALFALGMAALSVGLIAAAGAQGLQRRADGMPGYEGPSPFLVFAAVYAVNFLAAIPLSWMADTLHLFGLESSLGLLVTLLVTAAIYAGLIQLLVVGPGALSWSDMGFRAPVPGLAGRLGDVARGAAVAIPVIFVTAILADILIAILNVVPESDIPSTAQGGSLGLNLLAAAVIAPIGEEIFFRGFTTTAWARSMGAGRAIVRGAVFFALVHILSISGSTADQALRLVLVAFVARLPVGYALGRLFLARRSIYASMALHATYNGLLIVIATVGSRLVGGG